MFKPRSGYVTEPRVAAPRGYPGIKLSKGMQPQRGCAHFEFPQLADIENRHNPAGVAIVGFVTQRSRAARQPWALLCNRFAVACESSLVHGLRWLPGEILFAGLCSLMLIGAGAPSIKAQNPAPNTETLKKANTRPAETAISRAEPWDGATVEKMAGQCVTLDTESGAIVFEVLPSKAPETVRSFLNLAAVGALDTTIFSRVVKGFVIQGGNLSTSEKWSAELAVRMSRHLPDEPSDVKHVRGIVSMARGDEANSATTHFFILVDSGPHLDGKFTAFGRVITGIEVADAINRAPAADEKPTVPVRITHAGVAPCQK